MNDLSYYVYAYLREDGTPYYIGKGKKSRYKAKNRTIFPKTDFSNVIICEKNLTDIGAYALERRLIKWYGRLDLGTGILHNKTDGGEGNDGTHMRGKSYDEIYGTERAKEILSMRKRKRGKMKTFTKPQKHKCPHCQKLYDPGNLKRHLARISTNQAVND